jgi:hypothetical protein
VFYVRIEVKATINNNNLILFSIKQSSGNVFKIIIFANEVILYICIKMSNPIIVVEDSTKSLEDTSRSTTIYKPKLTSGYRV